MKFSIIDTERPSNAMYPEPDINKIVRTEGWASSLDSCCLHSWGILEDGNIIILEEQGELKWGKYIICPKSRFLATILGD